MLLYLFAISMWLLVFLLIWKTPNIIGWSGENFVSKKLHELAADKYTVLDDIMLPSDGNIKTAQIDHLVVSVYGIFCIETKAYAGWIFGNAYDEKWTQVIFKYKKSFYNPMRQNYGHIKAIEKLVHTQYPNVPIIGYVAFPDADRIRVVGTENADYATNILKKIRNINKEVISKKDKDKIVDLILNANISDRADRKLHNKNAHNLKKAREEHETKSPLS